NIPESILAPKQQCFGVPAECAPGTTISLHAFASGNDVPGQATLEGTSFQTNCLVETDTCISLEFTGQVIAPPFGQASTATVTVPVSFFGLFIHPNLQHLLVKEQLVAAATATLTLQETECCGSPAWLFKELRYDLVATPEPTTFLLWGTAAVGV